MADPLDLELLSDGILLTEAEATQALRLGKGTLRKWRREGRRPAFLTLEGRYFRYRVGDLRAWLNEAAGSSRASVEAGTEDRRGRVPLAAGPLKVLP